MSTGASNSTIRAATAAMAAQNTVDGTAVTLSTSAAGIDIQIGLWNTTTKAFTTDSNAVSDANNTNAFPAVKVWAKRTSANGNPISLVFGQVLGAKTCDVNATAVAELYPADSQNYSGTGATTQLQTTSDPWLAGVSSSAQTTAYQTPPLGYTDGKTGTASSPDSNYGSSTDHFWKYDLANPSSYGQTKSSKNFSSDSQTGQPYSSPMQVGSSSGALVNGVNTIAVVPGDLIQLSNFTQAGTTPVNNDFTKTSNYNAQGSNGGTYAIYSNTDDPNDNGNGPGGQPENGISNIYVPVNSAIGVFLDNNDPTSTGEGGVSPSNPNGTAPTGWTTAPRSLIIPTFEPQLRNKSFYVGNGQTSSSAEQSIIVPTGATRFFLATMDGHEWSNNSGGFNFSINEYKIVIVQRGRCERMDYRRQGVSSPGSLSQSLHIVIPTEEPDCGQHKIPSLLEHICTDLRIGDICRS